jgi:hypothetical protein
MTLLQGGKIIAKQQKWLDQQLGKSEPIFCKKQN